MTRINNFLYIKNESKLKRLIKEGKDPNICTCDTCEERYQCEYSYDKDYNIKGRCLLEDMVQVSSGKW